MGKKTRRTGAKATHSKRDSSSEFETESETENVAQSKPSTKTSKNTEKRSHTDAPERDVYDCTKYVDGEAMMYDPAAYALLHDLTVEWPSLSFDWLRSEYVPVSYPFEGFMVIGTQSSSGKSNYLRTMKVENLHRTYEFADDEDTDERWRANEWVSDQLDEKSEDGDFDLDAELGLKDPSTENLGYLEMKTGSINKIRVNPHNALIAAWSADTLHISRCTEDEKFALHEVLALKSGQTDGWALHWSPLSQANHALVAGNADGTISVLSDATSVDSLRTTKAAYAVEDIQFSPTEPNVFIAGGGDGHLEVFDTRDTLRAQLRWNASPVTPSDVNAIAWNPIASSAQFVCTGQDNGTVKVWDLRSVSATATDAVVKEIKGYHKSPINAIQWCPSNESVCIACSDSEASIYDFSVERDFQEEVKMAGGKKGSPNDWLDELQRRIPAEVLFEHGGLRYAKDIRFHPQIQGFLGVTHYDGYQLFRPINWKSLYD